jgi:co-chaperonin GroES (HSP10)
MLMHNTSGIYPAGHRVLIRTESVKKQTESGIILETDVSADRAQLAQVRGTVVEVGPTAYADQPAPWCKIGDIVTFGKYSGLIYKGEETADGNEYRMVNDLDIVATHDTLEIKGKDNE